MPFRGADFFSLESPLLQGGGPAANLGVALSVTSDKPTVGEENCRSRPTDQSRTGDRERRGRSFNGARRLSVRGATFSGDFWKEGDQEIMAQVLELAFGEEATLEVRLRPATAGPFTLSASAQSSAQDLALGDNHAEATGFIVLRGDPDGLGLVRLELADLASDIAHPGLFATTRGTKRRRPPA
jgi:hypothetical protein